MTKENKLLAAFGIWTLMLFVLNLVVGAYGIAKAQTSQLTANQLSQPSNGTLVLNSDGSFQYIPNPGYCGPDSFQYEAVGVGGVSNPATVNITVNCVPDPPIAVDDNYSVDEDNVLEVPAPGVLANDIDPEADTLIPTPTSAPIGPTPTSPIPTPTSPPYP